MFDVVLDGFDNDDGIIDLHTDGQKDMVTDIPGMSPGRGLMSG